MNVLEVSLQQSIQVLHALGWSLRRIARELGCHRKTVAGYVAAAKRPISTPGSAEDLSARVVISPPGSEATADAKVAISTAGFSGGRVSLCREFLPMITAAVSAGLSATRIHHETRVRQFRATSCQDIGQSLRHSTTPRRRPCRRDATAPAAPLCSPQGHRVLGGDVCGLKRSASNGFSAADRARSHCVSETPTPRACSRSCPSQSPPGPIARCPMS